MPERITHADSIEAKVGPAEIHNDPQQLNAAFLNAYIERTQPEYDPTGRRFQLSYVWSEGPNPQEDRYDTNDVRVLQKTLDPAHSTSPDYRATTAMHFALRRTVAYDSEFSATDKDTLLYDMRLIRPLIIGPRQFIYCQTVWADTDAADSLMQQTRVFVAMDHIPLGQDFGWEDLQEALRQKRIKTLFPLSSHDLVKVDPEAQAFPTNVLDFETYLRTVRRPERPEGNQHIGMLSGAILKRLIEEPLTDDLLLLGRP